MAIIVAAFMVLMVFTFFENKSISSKQSQLKLESFLEGNQIQSIPFFDQAKILLQDPSFIMLAIAGGASFGTLGSIGSVISEILDILDYSQV